MNKENKYFEEIQEKTKEIIVKNTKSNCISCKGYEDSCASWIYCEKLKELEDIEGFDETGELDGCIFFIKNTDEKLKSFELKEGMKFKVVSEIPKHSNFIYEMRVYLGKELTIRKIGKFKEGYLVKESSWFFNNEFIDWEETRKLNEVKEKPKQEKYIIWNPKGCNPKKIHETLKSAEQEVERLALSQPNEDFYVLEVVKKVRGSVSIVWE